MHRGRRDADHIAQAYEAIGGEVIRKRTRELHGFPVQETAYAWRDLAVIEALLTEPVLTRSTKPAQ